MPSQRLRRLVMIERARRRRRILMLADELRIWDEAAPVGREFGSPDFERLMAEDHRDQVGVFDPALRQTPPP